MKKLMLSTLLTAVTAFNVNANQSYQLITVSSYLNFYLLNINACEDFHPETRKKALEAEKKIYPWLDKLDQKLDKASLNKKDKEVIANTVVDRRNKLNVQIDEGDFTVEHCNAVISIVEDGLDESILKTLN